MACRPVQFGNRRLPSSGFHHVGEHIFAAAVVVAFCLFDRNDAFVGYLTRIEHPRQAAISSRRYALSVEAPPEVTTSGASHADPTQDQFLAKLNDLAEQGLSEEAEDMLYEMIDSGMDPTTQHYNALIRCCVPAGDIERAERWIFRMQALEVQPDIESYNSMIQIAAQAEDLVLAEDWLEKAIEAGLDPNINTFHMIMSAVQSTREIFKAEIWFERMMAMGLEPDNFCCNMIIRTFASRKKKEKVLEWISIMEENLSLKPDIDTFNFALEAYAKFAAGDDLQRGEVMIQEMMQRGLEPTARTYTLMTGDGRQNRDIPTVDHYSQRLQEAGVELDKDAYKAVIGAWVGVGNAKRAEEWFSRMISEDKQTAEALALVVDALVLSGGAEGAEAAEAWIEQATEGGLQLSASVYAALAAADVYRGDFEQVEARMQQMEFDGVEMNEDSVVCLLLAYANARPQQSMLAEQLFKRQMFRGKLEASRTILEALRAAVGGSRCLELRRELRISKTNNEGVDPSMQQPRVMDVATKTVPRLRQIQEEFVPMYHRDRSQKKRRKLRWD